MKANPLKSIDLRNRIVYYLFSILVSSILIMPLYIFYFRSKTFLVEEIGQDAKNLAIAVARIIEQDLDGYRSIYYAESESDLDFNSGYYQTMLTVFNQLKTETNANYIFTEKLVNDHEIMYILDGEKPGSENYSPLGSRDGIRNLEKEAFVTEKPLSTNLIDDPIWGLYISGYAPIHSDKVDESLGLVGVAFSADYLTNQLKNLRLLLYISQFIYFLLIFLVTNTFIHHKLEELKTDYMTGLKNLKYFDWVLKRRMKKNGQFFPASLMMIDLDEFKKINDKYGHLIGDLALKRIAHIIKSNIKRTDLAARYGGDEIIILFPQTPTSIAKIIGERIINKVNQEEIVTETNQLVNLSISVGITGIADKGGNRELLIKKADEALRKAKQSGKNNVCIL